MIATNTGFSIGSNDPIDSRQFFKTIAEMKACPENLIPPTYFCACDGKFYIYNETNADNPTTGKWRDASKSSGSQFENNVAQFKNYSDLITQMEKYSTVATIPNGMTVALQESETITTTDKDGSTTTTNYSYGLYRYNSTSGLWEYRDYLVREELENHARTNLHVTSYERNLWTNKANTGDIPTKVSQLTDDMNLSQIHTHHNKTVLDSITQTQLDDIHNHDNKIDVLDKLSVLNNKLAFDGALVSNATVNISLKDGNIAKNESDGLFVPATDLSDYAKNTDVILKTSTITETSLDDTISKTHEHDNKDIIDKFSLSQNGKLLLDGNVIGANVDISAEPNNGIQSKPDGIFVDVSSYHEHSNETVLNKFSESSTGGLQYDGIDIEVGNTKWEDLDNKPFGDVSQNDFQVNNSQLEINYSTLDTKYADKLLEHSHPNKTVLDSITQTQLNDIHAHDNKYDVLDKLSANDNGELLFNGSLVASSNVAISQKDGQGLTNESDGLYVDLSPYEKSDNLTTVKANSHAHPNKTVLDNVTQDIINDSHKHDNKNILDNITQDDLDDIHNHANKTDILDNLGQNANGSLTFNGVDVASGGVTVDPDTNNIISLRANGLYAEHQDLSDYAKTVDVQSIYLSQADAESDYMKLGDYTDSTTSKILGEKIKNKSIPYLSLDGVGQLDGVNIEQKLLSHLKNTQIHNIGTLNSLLINSDEWLKGSLTDFVVESDGTLGLAHTADDPVTYTLNQAVFESKIYDVSKTMPFITLNCDALYNPYLSNVSIYVRTGDTDTYNETDWTDWVDVTDSKSLSGMFARYIQLKVTAQTSDRFQNISFVYFQIFYGEDANTEITNARVALDGTEFGSLKQHLDYIEGKEVDKIKFIKREW